MLKFYSTACQKALLMLRSVQTIDLGKLKGKPWINILPGYNFLSQNSGTMLVNRTGDLHIQDQLLYQLLHKPGDLWVKTLRISDSSIEVMIPNISRFMVLTSPAS